MKSKEQYLSIRAEMVRNGITNRKIAQIEEVRANYVYMVLAGLRTGYRIRRAIARAVHLPVETLWPDTPVEFRGDPLSTVE